MFEKLKSLVFEWTIPNLTVNKIPPKDFALHNAPQTDKVVVDKDTKVLVVDNYALFKRIHPILQKHLDTDFTMNQTFHGSIPGLYSTSWMQHYNTDDLSKIQDENLSLGYFGDIKTHKTIPGILRDPEPRINPQLLENHYMHVPSMLAIQAQTEKVWGAALHYHLVNTATFTMQKTLGDENLPTNVFTKEYGFSRGIRNDINSHLSSCSFVFKLKKNTPIYVNTKRFTLFSFVDTPFYF